MTWPDHDADGLATWTVVQCGVKFYTALRLKDELSDLTRRKLLDQLTEIVWLDHEQPDSNESMGMARVCDAWNIYVHPGDLL